MNEKPESPTQRGKRLPLWQWGLLCILAGVVANQVMGMGASPASSAAARGEAFGRGVAALLFIVVGIVLIVTHFVRRIGR